MRRFCGNILSSWAKHSNNFYHHGATADGIRPLKIKVCVKGYLTWRYFLCSYFFGGTRFPHLSLMCACIPSPPCAVFVHMAVNMKCPA